MVIVDYVVGLIVVLSTVIDPKPVRVRRHKPVSFTDGYQSSVNRGPETERVYPWNCADLKSWKVNSRHARKNWMRHPHRIENTGGTRVLIV
jgi:hypothetical protein